MDLQIKLLELKERGNYLIVLTRGSLGIEGFGRVFQQIKDATQPLTNCKILIDLADAVCRVDAAQIERLVDELSADFSPRDHRLALISPADIGQYDQLSQLRTSLANGGFKAAVFSEPKAAADWLAENR